jgi:hypothetical protein
MRDIGETQDYIGPPVLGTQAAQRAAQHQELPGRVWINGAWCDLGDTKEFVPWNTSNSAIQT